MTDTAGKRMSATSLLVPSMVPAIFPDGTIAQEDRQAVSWSYSGISAFEVIIQAIVATIRVFASVGMEPTIEPSVAGDVSTPAAVLTDPPRVRPIDE